MKRRTLALLLCGFGLTSTASAQPPADHVPSRARKFTLPIQFDPEKRKTVQQVQLLVSRDGGQTWEVHDAVTPDKEHFNLTAKDDGPYWLTMMIRHKDGTSDPPDLTKVGPDRVLKYLIDATPPAVRVVAARRDGDEVMVEWEVEDKNPNDPASTVSYKTTGDWVPVPANAVSRRAARFPVAGGGAVAVRVSVQDAAGNPGTVIRELPGTGGTTANYAPTPTAPVVVPVVASQSGGLGAPTLPPPVLTPTAPATGPLAPVMPTVTPAAPVPPPAPPAPLPQPTSPPAPPPSPPAPPPAAPVFTPSPAPLPDAGPPPLATSGGTTPAFAPAAPTPADVGPVQHVKVTQFQLSYQLDAGPSGVRQIDLYVTRDDGRSWVKWSQHDGRENPLRVNLTPRSGGAADGDYGFKLVSISGANLSDDPPATGSPPDVRVRVDTTPPLVSVWPVAADPANRGAVLLRWKAEDANLTENSLVGIDWSDSPSGPWRPVAGVEPTAVNVNPAAVGRVPNRGTYSWQLPATLPGHLVYFRFTAVDPAGNPAQVVTPPQTVDLHRPKARIQAVVTAGPPR